MALLEIGQATKTYIMSTQSAWLCAGNALNLLSSSSEQSKYSCQLAISGTSKTNTFAARAGVACALLILKMTLMQTPIKVTVTQDCIARK